MSACPYCCGAGPLCLSTDPDHDDMTCEECAAESKLLDEPHAECLAMVAEYEETVRRENALVDDPDVRT